jgi:hypothetical protein
MTPLASRAQAAGLRSLTDEERAIVRSVSYASIFDYPLTLAQLRETLIESRQTPSEILETFRSSAALRHEVSCCDGFFCLRGREATVAERRVREARSRTFLEAHRAFLSLVTMMPYVRMVALSGSVAHLNLEGAGDLDLCIVTRGRRVWSVTVATIVLAKLLGRRRTVCANFVVADTRLALEPQDLFTASQVIHLKPVVGSDMYRRLLAANPFVQRLYPNFHLPIAPRRASLKGAAARAAIRLVEIALSVPSMAVEAVCRRAYRAYLLRRSATWRSPDQVRLDADLLKLHTHSHRGRVLAQFDLLAGSQSEREREHDIRN